MFRRTLGRTECIVNHIICNICLEEQHFDQWRCSEQDCAFCSWQMLFGILLGERHSASTWTGTMQRQDGRKSHPVFVHYLCLCRLPARTTIRQGALCSLLQRCWCSGELQGILKLKLTFFLRSSSLQVKRKGFFSQHGGFIYFDNGDTHSAEILIAQSRSLYL